MPDRKQLAATALDLARTCFESPIFDAGGGRWNRAMALSSGQADTAPHHYYGLCNLYALAQAGRILPELLAWRDRLLHAGARVLAEAAPHPVLGYAGPRLENSLDQYSFALLPAALCAAHELGGGNAPLEKALEAYAEYRLRFPTGKTRCVQASNHFVLSALALRELTGDPRFLDDARRETRHLLDACRLVGGAAHGLFSDEGRVTGFSRHCYGTWALMAMHRAEPSNEYVEAASRSLAWWGGMQWESGLFPFFYDARDECWTNTTTYAVHQKGMLLLSAWDIDRECGGAWTELIRRAMAACDDRKWLHRSPAGWWAWRRSNRQPDEVYAYELGWQVLGHALGAREGAA